MILLVSFLQSKSPILSQCFLTIRFLVMLRGILFNVFFVLYGASTPLSDLNFDGACIELDGVCIELVEMPVLSVVEMPNDLVFALFGVGKLILTTIMYIHNTPFLINHS